MLANLTGFPSAVDRNAVSIVETTRATPSSEAIEEPPPAPAATPEEADSSKFPRPEIPQLVLSFQRITSN